MMEKIRKAIENFNKYKSKEADASLIKFNNKTIRVNFSGELLCKSCCLNDYFEDLMYDFKDTGIENEIKWINTDDYCENYVVEYEIL